MSQLFVWFHDISISLLDNLFVVNMKQDLKVASTYQVLIIFTKISIENYNRAVYSAWFYKEILILYLSLFYSRTFLIDWKWGNYETKRFLFCHRITAKELIHLKKSLSHKTNGDQARVQSVLMCGLSLQSLVTMTSWEGHLSCFKAFSSGAVFHLINQRQNDLTIQYAVLTLKVVVKWISCLLLTLQQSHIKRTGVLVIPFRG